MITSLVSSFAKNPGLTDELLVSVGFRTCTCFCGSSEELKEASEENAGFYWVLMLLKSELLGIQEDSP